MTREEREELDGVAANLFIMAISALEEASHNQRAQMGMYDTFSGVLFSAGFKEKEDIFLESVEGELIPVVVYKRGTIHSEATRWLKESVKCVRSMDRNEAISVMIERIKRQRGLVAAQSQY